MTDPFGTQINSSNIYSGAWSLFYNLIYNNITDPKSRGVKWIYGSNPKWIIEADEDTEMNENYPLIVIENVEITNQTNETLDYATKEYIPQIVINVYSDRSDYVDTISEQIIGMIEDNESSFTDIGVTNLIVSNDGVNPDLTRGGLKIFQRNLSYTYEVQK